MKKKSQKLAYQPEYNFSLVGISSHENDYRLSWVINKNFDFNFIRVEYLEIKEPDKNQLFSVYNYEDEVARLDFSLIANRCDNGFLIEEMRGFDYFLKISGEIKPASLTKFIADLKMIDVINMAAQVDPNSLSSKQKLVF